jgi:predicted Zn-dependent protease
VWIGQKFLAGLLLSSTITFTLYLPQNPQPGRIGTAISAEEFAEALEPSRGAALGLAAAALWLELGNAERAQDVLDRLLENDEIRPTVSALIAGTALDQLSTDT